MSTALFLQATYDQAEVALSLLIAMLASYVALDLVVRVGSSNRRHARWWIAGGSLALGTGIWSMHFVGMGAYDLPIAIGYTHWLTFASWCFAVMTSAVALGLVGLYRTGWAQLAGGALVMGAGILAMHYTGMAAIDLAPGIVWDTGLVAVSAAVAVAVSAVALVIFSRMRQSRAHHTWVRHILASAVLGLAIAGAHYTAMAAASFPLNAVCLSAGSLSSDSVGMLVAAASTALLLLTLGMSGVDASASKRSSMLTRSLKLSNARLIESIAQLQQASAAAEAASRAKTQFLANMSHEIRTPMNAVLGMLTLLKRTELDGQQADYSAKAESAARSLLVLLNEILDFSKIESGMMALEHRAFRLDQLVGDVGLILAGTVGERPLDLRQDLDPSLPAAVVGDATRLRQVLINLGGNAVKFTADGEVALSVRRVAESAKGVTLEFAVTDTGIGIAPENQARIFQSFVQAEGSITRRFGGTGLGLSISQQLVGMMGGELKVQSTLGQGSRFYFQLTLPLAEATDATRLAQQVVPQTATSECDDALPHARLPGLRLLVVEDNPHNQQVARELLEMEGAQVSVAENGRVALEMALETAQTRPFDLVLMDLQMPEMDGFTATRHLRAQPQLSQLPIIAMTANTMESERNACLAAGMVDHVGKPFDLDDLVHTICRHVRQARRRAPATPSAHAPKPPAVPVPAGTADLNDDIARAAQLDAAAAIARMGGMRDVYLIALSGMIEELTTLPGKLDACATDAERVRVLHTCKGLAGTVGATGLQQMAATAEKQVATGDAGAALTVSVFRAQVTQILPRLQRALADWQMQAQTRAALSATRGSTQDIGRAIKRLRDQLQSSDLGALDSVRALRQLSAQGSNGAINRLEHAVKALDFQHAMELCDSLLHGEPA